MYCIIHIELDLILVHLVVAQTRHSLSKQLLSGFFGVSTKSKTHLADTPTATNYYRASGKY